MLNRPYGRPPIDSDSRLDRRLQLAISREEYEELRHEATSAGFKSLSEYVRERKLKRVPSVAP